MIQGIYAITDDRGGTPADFVHRMEQAWAGGAAAIQIREKSADRNWLTEVAVELIRRGWKRGNDHCRLYLNGSLVPHWPWHLTMPDGLHLGAGNGDAAWEWLADGAGCGAGTLPWIWSAHSAAEAEAAFGRGAAAVTISPIFPTASHPDQEPGGLELLRETVERCPGRTVIALGGISPGRLASCRRAGASAVAMIGAAFGHGYVEQAVRSLVTEWDGAVSGPDSGDFK